MIQTNINPSFTEIYIGGGNFITENSPTNFHTFTTRKILVKNDDMSNYKEVTAAQRAALEKSDAAWTRPPQSFIDLWNKTCGSHGRYNESTGFFELNGLTDITYDQALAIYACYSKSPWIRQQYWGKNIRTNIPTFLRDTENLSSAFYSCKAEVIRLSTGGWVRGDFTYAFRGCTMLRVICPETQLDFSTNDDLTFEGCGKLEDVRIKYTGNKLNLSWSPKLSYETLKYLVDYAQVPKNGCLMMFHKNVYAKLTDPDNEDWYPLLAQATEKNIQFATT